MGMSVSLIGMFYKASWPGSTIVDAHRALERAGFQSEPTYGPDAVKYERKDANYNTVGIGRKPIAEAVEKLSDGQHMEVRYEGGPDSIEVTYRSGPEVGDLPMPVGIRDIDAYYFDPEAVGDDAVAERVERFRDAFIEVANGIDPDVGFLMLHNDHAGMEAVPGGTDPSDHDLNGLPFMLALSEPWVEYCGGHDHVMDAPVYRTEALDTGGVIVQVTERPDPNGDAHDGVEYFFGD